MKKRNNFMAEFRASTKPQQTWKAYSISMTLDLMILMAFYKMKIVQPIVKIIANSEEELRIIKEI